MKFNGRCGALAMLVACGLLLGGCAAQYEDVSQLADVPVVEDGQAFTASTLEAPHLGQVQGMSLAAQNEHLALYINEKNAQIAVCDLKTGALYFSNPLDVSEDPIATKTEKGALNSQLALYYYNAKQNEAVFYSAPDAVDKGQFVIESIENGLRVTYTLGDTMAVADLMPRYISPERMQQMVYDHLDEEQVKYIDKRYVESATRPGSLELPEVTRKSVVVAKKLAEYFTLAGYTWEDLAADNEQNDYVIEDTAVYAVVPLEYRLIGDHLSAQVMAGEISVSADIMLAGVDVLPYFGAAGTQEEGYMFVPAGSGAIIRFNNGKQKEAVYQQPIYGIDPVTLPSGRFQTSEAVRLPIFGVKNGLGAFLAVVSQGEAQGYVTADVSGRKNSYNYVFTKFKLRASDMVSMTSSSGSETAMQIFEKNIYQGALTVDYYFLSQDAGYSEMAQRYRQLLLESGQMKQAQMEDSAPIYVSVVGAIEKTEHILGVPYEATVSMTTFAQARELLETLNENGVTGVRMRYLGWFNGGVDHDVAKSVSLTKALGGKQALSALSDALEEQGGRLYPDAAFQYVYTTSSHYNSAREAARCICGEVSEMALYLRAGMPADYQNMGSRFFVNTPGILKSHIEGFLKDYQALELPGLSLRDLGSVLASDKYANRSVDRSLSQKAVEKQLDELGQSVESLLVCEANAYALSAADELINMPEKGAAFYILDESIPFYAMVVHGYLDYGQTALNVRDNYDRRADMLTMLENGSVPHFLLTYEESYRMSDSVYEAWYSTHYADWLEDIVAFNRTYEEVLAPLRQCTITAHEILDNGLRVTTYSNGTRICVNQTGRDGQLEGHVVKSMDYLVLKGGVNQ